MNASEREQQVRNLCDCIRASGRSIRLCSQLLNVTHQTVYSWRKKHPEVAEAIAEAQEEFSDRLEVKAIKSIVAAFEDGDWRAGAWILERVKPGKYARTDNRKLEGIEQQLIEIRETIIDAKQDVADEKQS